MKIHGIEIPENEFQALRTAIKSEGAEFDNKFPLNPATETYSGFLPHKVLGPQYLEFTPRQMAQSLNNHILRRYLNGKLESGDLTLPDLDSAKWVLIQVIDELSKGEEEDWPNVPSLDSAFETNPDFALSTYLAFQFAQSTETVLDRQGRVLDGTDSMAEEDSDGWQFVYSVKWQQVLDIFDTQQFDSDYAAFSWLDELFMAVWG
jgi:hypothetical protein